jgi:glycosyltransferase involved in cell wall biosynthesis
MNILLTIHEYLDLNSGAAGSTLKLGQEYQKLGHQVTYYSYDDLPRSLPGILKYFTFPFWVASFLWLQKSKRKFNVVDAYTGDIWIWAKWLSKLQNNSPLLVTRSLGLEHIYHLQIKEDVARGDLSLSWKYRLYRGGIHLWEVTQSLLHADLVYLLNSEERKYAVEVLGISPEKIHTVANGIPDYLLDLPFELITDEDTIIRIAQIGTFIDRKGIKFSVPALNNILSRYPNVEISFFGTACKQCTDVDEVYANFNSDVRDRIKVIPRFNHETLPELLKGHHIKLFPPLSEGFGKALIEAMACGLAPVTTTVGGPLDIISDRHDGLLVSLRDSQAIEQALEKLITDRGQLNKLRQNAYNTAQNYSWQRMAKERISLYEKALEPKTS